MPQMGESVTEGTVLEWTKAVGDAVEVDETLLEVSTDKVDTEVPSPADGVLSKILVEPDETVPVGTVLGEIEVGAEAAGGSSTGRDAAATSGNGATLPDASAPASGNGTPPPPAGNGSAGQGATGGQTVEVAFPQMGESVTEGTVLEWHKSVGDSVEVDETIVEVSTDKVDTEVPSPAAGTITEILVGPDETVAVGAVLCRIAMGTPAGQGDVGPAGSGQPGAAAAPPTDPAPAPVEGPGTGAPAQPPRESGNGGASATPVAARMADAHGIDLEGVQGTGPRGRVTKDDVQAAVEGNGQAATTKPAPPAPTVSAPPPPGGTTKPIRGPAAMLAKFMNDSRSIPTATSFRTVGVDLLDSRRKELKAAGRKLSFTHLIAWAIVQAARDTPVMAHSYAEIEGVPQRVDPGGVSLGLAVDVERRDGSRSLVVPVLASAHLLDFPTFVGRYDELVAGARDNTLAPEAYAGANMTLTNPGGIGTVASVPRLMPGQGTIVATGAIAYPPGLAQVSAATLQELGVSKVMTMTSTYDHRVIQGAESGAFLRRVDELLQGQDAFYENVLSALGMDTAAPQAPDSAVVPEDGAGAVTAAEPAPSPVSPALTGGAPDAALLQAVQAATSLVKAHRMHGHLAARLDPLGVDPPGDPALDPANLKLTAELMKAIPAAVLRVAVPGETFADALPHLQETYCGTIAYEIEHISDHQQRVWLRQAIESGHFRLPLPADDRRRLLERLSEVEALESYLHKAFLGKKQFSIEGLDVVVPMLDEALELASADGAREVVIGMAHRGRLNVLAHTVGQPYEDILAEFEAEQNSDVSTAQPEGGTGDVKYHHGASGTYRTTSGKGITVTLAANPSHLEFVDPVIEGRARADQTSRRGRELHHDPSVVLPVLLHGDAAFPGQGVVAETLNLQGVDGYSTGGTVHLITNNQLGFTTEPSEARSTRYASDLAKGFDIPIIHVNADDVEACIAAIRLAVAFRERFGRDALIDVIGYRRFGHNETDEPAYTQPLMYERIKGHPPVRRLYAEELVKRGLLSREEAEETAATAYGRLADAHARLKATMAEPVEAEDDEGPDRTPSREPKTALPTETLRSLNEQLYQVPEGFNVHRKLAPQLERRRKALSEGGLVDWAHAEALALGSLLLQKVPVRLTGQDSERGTFSQRHMVLHDGETGEKYTPIATLSKAGAPLELHNSPLSEAACLGFEYGYSVHAPEALVLWEAQFGDFSNSAQVIIDQFLVSGLAKWGQSTRLTMLLPHGYEGSGPEHSSARLERFMQLGSEGNIRIANCTTPAQYFHLLRRQALVEKRRPLVVMTPKSLLRLPAAASTVDELTSGSFQFVIDDPTLPGPREQVTRLILCSGKVYYDLVGHEARSSMDHVAVGRVELLYPFAENELRELMASYPSLETVVWAQEEPQNMGARSVMEARIAWILPDRVGYEYVGRPLRAAPSEGYPAAHLAQQGWIVHKALGVPEPAHEEPVESVEATSTSDPGE